MRYLLLPLLLAFASIGHASEYFSILSLCQNAESYRMELGLSADISGLLISPSHSANMEIYESGIVHIPLENEWVELRALGINPAPSEVLHFESVANCQNDGNEENARFVYDAVMAIKDRIGE